MYIPDFKIFFDNNVVAVGWSKVDFASLPDSQEVKNAVPAGRSRQGAMHHFPKWCIIAPYPRTRIGRIIRLCGLAARNHLALQVVSIRQVL